VAEKAVDLAAESFDLVHREYEGGAATITRYLQAELDYNRARVRKTAAFYDRERARADLARALGLLSGEV
jgi:outer membrane protein TolC